VSTAAARPDVTDSWDPTTSLTSLRYKEGQMDPRYVRPWIPRRRNVISNYRILYRLRYLLDKVGAVSRQSWCKISLPETWVDDSGSIILIGEAAHPQTVSVSSISPSSPKFLILSRSILTSLVHTMAHLSPWKMPPYSAHCSRACGARIRLQRFYTPIKTYARVVRTCW
jgi:hypothetical protein